MAKLPVISGKKPVRLLMSFGFEIVRQKGSHISMRRGKFKTVIPLQTELAKGTLLAIIKQCGLEKDDLIKLLGSK